jgi:hypothetical protein
MKNKILISVAILLILVVIGVRYEFNEKFEVFKTSISQYKTAQLETFRKEKENRIALLSNGDKKILQLFTEQFDESKAITERDTSFSFIYLSDKVKYKTASMKYLDCLNAKCINDQQNETNQKLIKAKENELEKRYGKTYLFFMMQMFGKTLKNLCTLTILKPEKCKFRTRKLKISLLPMLK